jgi:hypothetical protein
MYLSCNIFFQDQDDVMHKLSKYDNTLKINTELETKLKTVELERNRLNSEISRVRFYYCATYIPL